MFRTLRSRPKASRGTAVLATLAICAGVVGFTAAIAAATETPAGLTATSSTDESGGTVTVAWTAPTEQGLTAEVAIDSGPPDYPDPYDGSGATFYNIEPGEHTISLEFIDGGGSRSAPATVTVTVHPLPPAAPTLVEGHADGTNVTVSWTGDGTATSYGIELAGQTVSAAASASSVVVTGVAPNTYSIVVRAINGGGTSAPGIGSVVVTGDTTPGAPQNVSSTDDADRAVNVTWDAPASNGGDPISEYYVTVSFPNGPGCDDGAGGTQVCSYSNGQTIAGSSRSTVIYSLPADQGAYTVAVTAKNAVGTGPASAPTTLRDMVRSSAASAPTNVAATSPTYNKVTVTWTAPADGGKAITDYAVALTDNLFAFADGSARSMTLANVPAGSYTASVYAYNLNGSSPAGTASVTVSNPPPAVVAPPAVAPTPTAVTPTPTAVTPTPTVPQSVAPVATTTTPVTAVPAVAAPVVPTAPRSLRATVPSRGAVLTSWTGLSTVKGARVTGYIVSFAGQEKRLAGTKVAFGNVTKGTWTLKVVAVSAKGTSVASLKTVTVTAAKGSATRLTLKAGLRGTDVKKLQAALKMPLKARTGQFSTATVTKVKAWQKARKLRQTGVVNHKMRLALKV